MVVYLEILYLNKKVWVVVFRVSLELINIIIKVINFGKLFFLRIRINF